MILRRRTLVAAAGALALPAHARGEARLELRVVPRGDPGTLDTTADPRRDVSAAALLVFDTLYGIDSQFAPRPQMCAGHEASDDRRTWTFRLRPGLRFHDGTPVRAADVTASLWRWMARDALGSALRARLDALDAVGDDTFRFRLHTPFGPLPYALGKADPPLAVIMPEALARTDPTTPLPRLIGSGPLMAMTDEWQPGNRLVFARFDGYAPRDEAADWLAGGKRVAFDRVVWSLLPDPAQAAEALQTGAADWWAGRLAEQTPVLKRNRNLVVDIADPLGEALLLRLNPASVPFDSPTLRAAVRGALDQSACMTALTGGDDALWRAMDSIFTPGSPAARAASADAAEREAPRRAEASGAGASAGAGVMLAANARGAGERDLAQVTTAALRRLGLTAEQRPPAPADDPGPWQARIARLDGAACVSPFAYADVPALADPLAAWLAATTTTEAARATAAVNLAAVTDATAIPLGQLLSYQAWRTPLSGVGHAPLSLPWDVRKT